MTCNWNNGTLVTINGSQGVYKVVGHFTVSGASGSSNRNSRQRKCKYLLKKKMNSMGDSKHVWGKDPLDDLVPGDTLIEYRPDANMQSRQKSADDKVIRMQRALERLGYLSPKSPKRKTKKKKRKSRRTKKTKKKRKKSKSFIDEVWTN